jgi:polyvinyl alcohol dehydrogenase (cytochrome)
MSKNSCGVREIAGGLALAAALLASSCSGNKDAPLDKAAAAAQTDSTAVKTADSGAPHPGEAVYNEHCATCHDHPDQSKAPSKAALGRLSSATIENALYIGKMRAMASGMPTANVSYVADYLSHAETTNINWADEEMCPADRRTPKADGAAPIQTFGFDMKNKRQLSYEQAGFKPDDLPNLQMQWAFGFPEVSTMRSQAAVVGTTMFLPVGENRNRVYALDISDPSKPCVQWIYEAGRTLRSSASFGVRQDGRAVVMVGDIGAFIHMIDAKTGERIWESHMGLFEQSIATATPVLVGDKVIAPSSQYEIMMAVNDNHLCCVLHGGVVALDAMTGKRVWEAHTMENAKPLRDRGDGQMLWGPSGASIWNSPSIDLKRNRIYVGTGEANSYPADKNSDALIAYDLSTGKQLWSFQATKHDVYISGCGAKGEAGKNCPNEKQTVYRDVDFGASTILATTPKGRDLVIGGQKSGTLWAMDPDTGKLVWKQPLGTGTAMGGIHWGIAADETHVYAPVSFTGARLPAQDIAGDKVPQEDPAANIKPGLYAVNLEDGKIDWHFETTPDCTPERKKFVDRCTSLYGVSAAPTVIGDYVVAGGLDGRVYMLNRKTGKMVWQYDTAKDFRTTNGIAANGGTIDNAGIIAANGMLILNSGYSMFGQGPGNVTLAFKPKK